jgi:hypothetical protein
MSGYNISSILPGIDYEYVVDEIHDSIISKVSEYVIVNGEEHLLLDILDSSAGIVGNISKISKIIEDEDKCGIVHKYNFNCDNIQIVITFTGENITVYDTLDYDVEYNGFKSRITDDIISIDFYYNEDIYGSIFVKLEAKCFINVRVELYFKDTTRFIAVSGC